MDSYIIEIGGMRCEVEPMPEPDFEIFQLNKETIELQFSRLFMREVKAWAHRVCKQAYFFYLAGEH
jgi:hypothetical protein